MSKKKIILSVDVETEKEYEDVINAIKRGVFVELDNKRIAAPCDIKINYCEERVPRT